MIFLRVLPEIFMWPHYSGSPVHWTPWTPGSFATGGYIYIYASLFHHQLVATHTHTIKIRFNCDSTAVLLPFDCNSTVLRPFDDLHHDRMAHRNSHHIMPRTHRADALSVDGRRLSVRLSVPYLTISREQA